MLAFVAQLFDNGQPLPPTQSILSLPVKAGDLDLCATLNHDLPARAACAGLHDMHGSDVLPPIYDVVVERYGDGCLKITGTQHRRAGGPVPQAWFVQLYVE